MSIGRRIQQLRSESHLTQREISEATGLAVSYLSRVENGRLTPTLPTLTKIAGALSVPVTSLFDTTLSLEAKDTCPVSLSGRCILDHLFVGRGKKPKRGVETYTREQLETLRLCNFLLHTRDKQLLRTLITILKALLTLKEGEDRNRSSKTSGRLSATTFLGENQG